MDEAHARDYADQRKIDDLRRQIAVFLGDPPKRLSHASHVALYAAHHQLKADSDHIVAVWD